MKRHQYLFDLITVDVFVVTGFIEIKMSIIRSILTWIPWKKLNSPP